MVWTQTPARLSSDQRDFVTTFFIFERIPLTRTSIKAFVLACQGHKLNGDSGFAAKWLVQTAQSMYSDGMVQLCRA